MPDNWTVPLLNCLSELKTKVALGRALTRPHFAVRSSRLSDSPRRGVSFMSDTATKSVKVTEIAHARLVEATEAMHGTRHVRFSDVIESLASDEIARREDGG